MHGARQPSVSINDTYTGDSGMSNTRDTLDNRLNIDLDNLYKLSFPLPESLAMIDQAEKMFEHL